MVCCCAAASYRTCLYNACGIHSISLYCQAQWATYRYRYSKPRIVRGRKWRLHELWSCGRARWQMTLLDRLEAFDPTRCLQVQRLSPVEPSALGALLTPCLHRAIFHLPSVCRSVPPIESARSFGQNGSRTRHASFSLLSRNKSNFIFVFRLFAVLTLLGPLVGSMDFLSLDYCLTFCCCEYLSSSCISSSSF